MKRIRCFFICNRDCPDSVLPLLISETERHISRFGVNEFIVGGYGNFDRLAASAVISCKKHHSEVRLTLLLPYHPTMHHVTVPEHFDGTLYPDEQERVPPKYAIVRANRYAVDSADYLIAYIRYTTGNSAKLVSYARQKEQAGQLAITLIHPTI